MNVALLSQKLAQIAGCLGELESVRAVPFTEFRAKPSHFRLAERDVQLLVDSAVAVNNHLILEAGRTPPASYYESFLALIDLKTVPGPLARRLARSTGLRNRIVHQYESVDMRILHRALPALIADYREYVRRIRKRAGL